MKPREKRAMKLIAVLVPCLLLATWYGYSQIRAVHARRAARAKQAQRDVEDGQRLAGGPPVAPGASNPAADSGAAALPSPPQGATQAENHAMAPSAASPAALSLNVDLAAQKQRMLLGWGRDPFVPPDTEGPQIGAPANMESPRGKKTVELRVHISDRQTGNSGIRAATLCYGAEPPHDEHTVSGTPPGSQGGDGWWTFQVPAPDARPVGCLVVAADGSRLGSTTRSAVFTITPPPKETVRTQAGGADVKLTLRAISWSRKKGMALINDAPVAEGEVIHGYEVVKIARTSVTLRRGGEEVFLELKE